MIRTLALVTGLGVAGVTSQAPEFTQQYMQRLAGQVEALAEVARDFDTSALNAGLGREDALAQMTGTPFLDARQADMRRTFARHARLADTLATLRAASPVQRLTMPHRLMDPAVARATWADFAPAVPLTPAGLMAAGGGFVLGWGSALALLAVLARPFRRTPARSRPATTGPTTLRREPPLHRPQQPRTDPPLVAR